MNSGLVFMRSRNFVVEISPILAHKEEDGKYLNKDEGYFRRMNRVFETAEFGSRRHVNCRFVWFNAGNDGDKRFSVDKVLFLFRIEKSVGHLIWRKKSLHSFSTWNVLN